MAASINFSFEDFDEANLAITSEKVIDTRRLNAENGRFRRLFSVMEGPFKGKSMSFPIRDTAIINAYSRPTGGALGVQVTPVFNEWVITDSHFKGFDIPISVNVEQLTLESRDVMRLRTMKTLIEDSNRTYDVKMDRLLMCDENGTLAVVEAICKTDGTTAIDNTVTEAFITIDRTNDVGSLLRIVRGDYLAIHAAAAATVRVYCRVLEVKPGCSIGSLSKADVIRVSVLNPDTSAVTNASLALGPDSTDKTAGSTGGPSLHNIVAGDYIRTINSYGQHPYGVDAIASGTLTNLFGINQTTGGNDWSKPVPYAFGSVEWSAEKFDSALEVFDGIVGSSDRARLARMHPSVARTFRRLADAGVRVVRPMGSEVKGPLAQFGWNKFVYYPVSGEAIGIWSDPTQNYQTIDLIPEGIFHELRPANAPVGEWLGDPNHGGSISWERSDASRLIYEAHRIPKRIVFCEDPGQWMRITGVLAEAYK